MSKTIIKPITILRDTNKISDLCHSLNQPIHITKNGENDLVIMSSDIYDELNTKESNYILPENKKTTVKLPSSIKAYGYTRIGLHIIEEKITDINANKDSIINELNKAFHNKEKIVLFSELALTAYTCGDLFYQELLFEKIDDALIEIASYTKGHKALVIIGTPYRIEGKLYNMAAVINNGHIIAFVPKTYLPNYHEFYEQRQFVSGRNLDTTIKVGNDEVIINPKIIFASSTSSSLKVGIEICEDLWSPNPPSTNLALNGATIICNLSASNELVGKKKYREDLVSATSARLNCIYSYVSAGKGESSQDLVYSGSAMIAENGRLLRKKELYTLDNVYADVDTERMIKERQNNGSFEIEDNYKKILVDIEDEELYEESISPSPFLPNNDESLKDILDIQINSLARRLSHANFNAVIGVSGGLDSTLALIVSIEAMKLLNRSTKEVYALLLPAFGTSNRTKSNAEVLAETLGATTEIIDIKDSVTQHLKDLNHPLDLYDTTYENAQARERTQVLMDKANMVNGIVIGTGDLSESCLGWSTYNGDHMSNYAVNVSIPKTLVKSLINYYASKHKELYDVLKDILDTPVSPELLPTTKEGKIAQITEDLVGPYELHDFFIFYCLRYNFSPTKIFKIACLAFKDKYEESTILKWEKVFYKRFFAMQFKRSCLPDGPKVGSVSISPRGDLRMPSDATSEMFLEELENIRISK